MKSPVGKTSELRSESSCHLMNDFLCASIENGWLENCRESSRGLGTTEITLRKELLAFRLGLFDLIIVLLDQPTLHNAHSLDMNLNPLGWRGWSDVASIAEKYFSASPHRVIFKGSSLMYHHV